MKLLHAKNRLPAWTSLCLVLPLAGALAFTSPGDAAPAPQKENRYIGASKCKTCHSAVDSGNQHGEWSDSKHAHAFELLGTEEAKKVAAEKGIADPQKAPECVKCHVTGHGLPETSFKKGFDPAAGVQCETCHGPGEQHVAARMAAAMDAGGDEGFGEEEAGYVAPPVGEIIVTPAEETCRACHNAKSPTFEPFCFYERRDEVSHRNPKKPRSKQQIEEELACGCGDPCPCTESCSEHECAVPRGALKDASHGTDDK